MFTNEFTWDATVTTVLDEQSIHEDVELIVSDDYVCLRQWRDEHWAELIICSHQQWAELLQALSLPEGAYRLKNA